LLWRAERALLPRASRGGALGPNMDSKVFVSEERKCSTPRQNTFWRNSGSLAVASVCCQGAPQQNIGAFIATMTAPTLRFEIGSTVAPGDRIGNIRQILPGIGTYSKGGHIYASAVGKLTLSSPPTTTEDDKKAASKPIVSVQLPGGRQYASTKVLTVGQVVLGKVSQVVLQQAVIEIVAAQGVGALRNPHEGAIRRDDVRAGASEEVQLYDSFRPGDVVLCRIVSLGDSRRYYLSTSEPELGVVRATCSTSGKRMNPISWKEMECPETHVKESRKCAKPKNLSATLSSSVS